MSLPGVGRKTANVVLNTAFGQNTIGIDTHAFRVANRTGLAPGKTPLEVELKLERVVPERYKHNAHHWLILHGRYVCKARKPECWRCIIEDICLFKPKTPAPAASGATHCAYPITSSCLRIRRSLCTREKRPCATLRRPDRSPLHCGVHGLRL